VQYARVLGLTADGEELDEEEEEEAAAAGGNGGVNGAERMEVGE
jgi:hypothetical protein